MRYDVMGRPIPDSEVVDTNPANRDAFNIRNRAYLGDPNALAQLDPNDPENVPAATIKAIAEAAQREDQAQKDRLASQKNADAFIEGHPEFIDNNANAQLLLNQVQTMFGKGLHTVEQWEQAYEYLVTNTTFLKLDAKELAKKQKQAAKERYEASQASLAERTFDPNSNYENLTLEQIRDRANAAMREEMRLTAERGGFDAV